MQPTGLNNSADCPRYPGEQEPQLKIQRRIRTKEIIPDKTTRPDETTSPDETTNLRKTNKEIVTWSRENLGVLHFSIRELGVPKRVTTERERRIEELHDRTITVITVPDVELVKRSELLDWMHSNVTVRASGSSLTLTPRMRITLFSDGLQSAVVLFEILQIDGRILLEDQLVIHSPNSTQLSGPKILTVKGNKVVHQIFENDFTDRIVGHWIVLVFNGRIMATTTSGSNPGERKSSTDKSGDFGLLVRTLTGYHLLSGVMKPIVATKDSREIEHLMPWRTIGTYEPDGITGDVILIHPNRRGLSDV